LLRQQTVLRGCRRVLKTILVFPLFGDKFVFFSGFLVNRPNFLVGDKITSDIFIGSTVSMTLAGKKE
jgi:hypothetical protein